MNRYEFKEAIENELNKLSQCEISKMAHFTCRQIIDSALRNTSEKGVDEGFIHDPYKDYINFLGNPKTVGFFYMHDEESARGFWTHILADVINQSEVCKFFINRAKQQYQGQEEISISTYCPQSPDYSMLSIPYFDFEAALEA